MTTRRHLQRTSKRQSARRLQVEALERRELLAAEILGPPREAMPQLQFANIPSGSSTPFGAVTALAPTASWQPMGPFSATNGQVENVTPGNEIVGAIHTVLAHPFDADTLYVGGVNGGVWKTTNATSVRPTWTPLTDNLPSQSIGAMIFDRADPTFQTVYAGIGKFSSFGRTGGNRVGLLRTTDGGATWSVIQGGGVLDGKNISGVYAFGNTIVVSVNSADTFNPGNVGVFRSTDGGASFSPVSVGNGTGPTRLPAGVAYDLFADPVNPNVLYTATVFSAGFGGGQVGVYKSINQGATWAKVSNNVMDSLIDNGATNFTGTSNLEIAVGTSNNVYVAIINAGTVAGLFRSGNGGATWVAMDTPSTNENGTDFGLNPGGGKGPGAGSTPAQLAGGQGTIHFSMVADPTNANIIYAGGDRQPGLNEGTGFGPFFPNTLGANDFSGRLFRGDATRPSGSQWVHLTHNNTLGAPGGGTGNSSAPHADSREMVFDAAGNIIEVDDGGIYRRTLPRSNQGDWFSLNGNLQITEVHDVAYDAVSNILITGNQDTGTTQQAFSGATIWESISTGDGGDVVVDDVSRAAFNESIRYSSFQTLGGFRKRTYDANGSLLSQTFPPLQVLGGGAPFLGAFRTPVELNKVDPTRLVFQGANGTYESLDQGNTLFELPIVGAPSSGNAGVFQNAVIAGGVLNGVANRDLLWVGTGSNVLRRTTSGGPLTAVNTRPPVGTIRDLAVDPQDGNTVFVNDDNDVMMSIDAGNTWIDITGDLIAQATTIWSLAYIDGPIVDAVVAGTNLGVFATAIQALGTWVPVASNLPNVPVFDMEWDTRDDVLAAGTLGRGTWLLPSSTLAVQNAILLGTEPRLIAVAPNRGDLFDLDLQDQATENIRTQAPTELVLTFGGRHAIDPSTLGAISVQYSESGNFALDAVPVPIGFIGLDSSGRSVTLRFAENLGDGFFQLSVTSELASVFGIPFEPTFPQPVPGNPALVREVISFEIELGAKVIGVVAQPIVGGVQQQDKIDVYFDDLDLFRSGSGSTIDTKAFYQLVDTQNTVTTEDDVIALPIDVAVDATRRKVTLQFAANLDVFAAAGDSLRLRIGDSSTFNAINVTRHVVPDTIATDPGLTAGTANLIPVAASGDWSTVVVGQSIRNSTATGVVPMVDNPGGILEPGHRDIEVEDHYLVPGSRDSNNAITTIPYTFLRNTSYATNSQGTPLFNQMNADQERRFLEILELYGNQLGIDFFETESSGLSLIVGDLSTADPTVASGPGGVAGLGGPGRVTMDALDFQNAASNQFGQSFFNVALHEIGHAIGLGHSYELPPGTVQGSSGEYPDTVRPGPGTEWAFPGDNDLVHGTYLHQSESLDVDLYRVNVAETGVLKVQTFAERLPDASLLDTRLSLFRQAPSGNLELVSSNEDYFGSDSFIEFAVQPGTYFVGVSSEGNALYDPDSGLPSAGGTSEGSYELRVDFTSETATAIRDADGSLLDGDRDGVAGGNYNFWFEPTRANTIFVNKAGGTGGGPIGSFTNPYRNIPAALTAASAAVASGQKGVVVRLLPNGGADNDVTTPGDNIGYEIGFVQALNQTLADGRNLVLPGGVHLSIDAGVIMKFLDARVSVGSDDDGNDRSEGTISVQGTPTLPVYFTSYNDRTLGSNSNILGTPPRAGDWGGIEIRNDVDRLQGRLDIERRGIFQNYVNHAMFAFGGGEVSTINRVIDPIHLSQARAELSYNTITTSSDAAMSADPDTFGITTFTEPRFQKSSVSGNGFSTDYERKGPDIYGNLLFGNSTNGIFVRIDTPAGGGLETLQVPAAFNDTDIVHVLGESLLIEGQAGGPVEDSRRPSPIIGIAVAAGGTLAAGNYQYSYTFVDSFGFESPGSTPQAINSVPAGSRINLTNIAAATGKYVARRLYRSNGGPFLLVAELDKTSRDYTDNLQTPSTSAATLNVTAGAVRHGRIDGSLIVAPGTIIKNQGARIQLGFGANFIAEGLDGQEIIFTARADDRFGAGGSFDTNGDGASAGAAADWAGIYASPTSRLSIDQAYIAFAGGVTGVNGGTARFNPIQIHQADARIANTIFEDNADGFGATQVNSRRDFAPNAPASIYVTAAQPTIVGNTFVNNSGAAVSINVNAMNSEFVSDLGRQTGHVDLYRIPPANNGPVFRGNRLAGNGINGVAIRGEVLTTEVVWDDTDIVHVLQSDIEIPDLHTFGGMRLESSFRESLVVKADGAEILATGRSLDITDRIGGRLMVLGQPGFPVVITSIHDNTVGAGFTPDGNLQNDTIAGPGTPSPGDWQGLKFDPYSHDRNVATFTEREGLLGGFGDSNAVIGSHQELGLLAQNEKSGDENIRLGFTVHGAIADDLDQDMYSFDGVAGSMVWFDIDRTDPRLDTVLELIDGNGRVLALSQNSRTESVNGQLTYTNTTLIRDGHALPMQLDHDAPLTAGGQYRDLYTTNDGDSGMRVVLPGSVGTRNTFYVRVRSSNAASDYTTIGGINASLIAGGTTQGGYQLQIRLTETDEHAGSVVRYADLRYATSAIVAIGLPAHSPIAGELFNPGGLLDLGNFSNTDRGAISIAGTADNTVDTYTFNVNRDSLQGINPTDNSLGIVIDVDWADGLTRPNTNAYLYNGTTLIAIGTNSNISDDRITPIVAGQPTTEKDLSRGTFGARDAFIGPLELSPNGDYQVVIGTDGQTPADMNQFFRFTPLNTNARLEPLDSVVRIADDRFDFEPTGETDTPVGPAAQIPFALQVAFNDDGSNVIPWQFGDIPLITVSRAGTDPGRSTFPDNSQLNIFNPFTGRHDAIIDENTNPVGAAASRPVALQVPASDPARFYNVLAIERPIGTPTDANTDTVYAIEVDGRLTAIATTGIDTYEYFDNGDTDPATNSNRRAPLGRGGMTFSSLAYYNDTNSQTSFLYGLANRVTFDGSIVGANAAGADIISGFTVPVNAGNLIYLLNPATGQAQSRNSIAMRGGFESASPQDPRLQNDVGFNIPQEAPWAGTNIIAQVQVPTTKFSTGLPTGNVTSLVTDIAGGQVLYAFTDTGTVWRLPINEAGTGINYGPGDLLVNTTLDGTQPTGRRLSDANIFVDTTAGEAIRDSTGKVLIFDQVTKGPANATDPLLRSSYFGVETGTGRLYAFNLNDIGGTARFVFEFGGEFTQLDGTVDGTGLGGLFFSSLDRELWHTSDTLSTAPGHGMGLLDDRDAVIGGGSLRFGFDALNDDHSHLNLTGIFDTTLDAEDLQGFQGYNFLGGAHGTVHSNTLDLSGFSAADLPTLYFTYLLDTENTNADNNPNNGFDDAGLDDVMRDSLRVSVAGPDGVWRLVATNNMDDPIGGRVWDDSRGNVHEYDPVGSNQYTRVEEQRFVQELFDGDVFRQARIDLGPWAGQKDVRIRFDFSTAGEVRPDQSEIHALRGEQISDGHRLTITGLMPERTINNQGATLISRTKRFEFDLGLVAQMPAGSQVLTAGGSITLAGPGGTIIELVTGAGGGPLQVSVLATDTAAQVAQKVRTFVGASAIASAANPSWVGFTAQTTPGAYTFSGINNFILSTPGVAATFLPIPVDITMTNIAVRDQIQLALANEIRYGDTPPNLVSFPVVGNTNAVRIYDLLVVQTPPSAASTRFTLINGENAGPSNMPGSGFGVYSGGSNVSALLRAGERSRGLSGSNGVYIDDIVIGLAERGESFTDANQGTALVDNPYFQALKYFPFEGIARPVRQEVTAGEYQLEIRLGREYLGPDNAGKDARIAINERLANGLNLRVDSSGSNIVDGDTFQISNGFETLRFEFNDITVPALTTPTTPGNVIVNYRISDTTAMVADSIRNAINSASVRAALGVEATSRSGALVDATDPFILFHGYAAATNLGGIVFRSPESGLIHMTGLITGRNVVRGEDNGDRNLRRDQGVFNIDSNIISFSFGTAIDVSAGPIQPGNKVAQPAGQTLPDEGNRPKPGAVQHLATLSNEELVHGAIVQNNLLISNGNGIALSGNSALGGPQVYSRVLNNTIFNSNTAIRIANQAAPTLLNNVLVDNTTGIVGQNQGPTVVRATVYSGNLINSNGIGLGTEAIVNPSGPLFVNPVVGTFDLAGGSPNFYPAAGSVLIDSSIQSQLDRPTIIAVKDSVGIPRSPIVVTARDLAGQLREDGSTTSGQGQNINIDRGALDRSDTTGPQALIIVPADNDAAGIYVDRNDTFLQLREGLFNFFEILITEGAGIGPDSSTITTDQITVFENGRRLTPGTDITIAYNAANRTLRLTPTSGIWRPDAAYEIVLLNKANNSLIRPVSDLAGNFLQPNRSDGQTRFTIVMPQVALDFGDAPDSYRTRFADNGARHAIVNQATPRLGNYVDGETDSMGVGSDDIKAVVSADGNVRQVGDGPFTIAIATDVTVTLNTLPLPGDNLSVTAGNRTVVFELVEGGGSVAVGRVPVDYPVGATLDEIMDRLSAVMQIELLDQNVQAVVQHTTGTTELVLVGQDDEDGVSIGSADFSGTIVDGVFLDPVTGEVLSFLNPFAPNGAELVINTVGGGFVDAWVDFNGDGDFFDADEQVLISVPVVDGENRVQVFTPLSPAVLVGGTGFTWARFRLNSVGGNQTPDGLVVGGEVEDYRVFVAEAAVPEPLINQFFSTDEDLDFTATVAIATDAGASDLRYVLDSNPSNGTVTLDPITGEFTYDPDEDFYGDDTFTFRLTGTQLVNGIVLPVRSSSPGAVTLTVNPINDAPFSVDQSYVVTEPATTTTTTSITLTSTDLLMGALPQDDALLRLPPFDELEQTLRVIQISVINSLGNSQDVVMMVNMFTPQDGVYTAPTFIDNGSGAFVQSGSVTVTVSGSEIVTVDYLAKIGGPPRFDQFVYTIADDGATTLPNGQPAIPQPGPETSSSTVNIQINVVNDPPSLDQPPDIAIAEDTTSHTVNLSGIDAGGQETQSLRVTATSSDLTLMPNPVVTYTSANTTGTLTLVPNLDRNGLVNITVTVRDAGFDGIFFNGDDNSFSRVFTVRVTAVNDAPIASPDVISSTGSAWLGYFAGLGQTAPVPTEDQTLVIPRDFLLDNDRNGPATATDELSGVNDGPLSIVGQQFPSALGGLVTVLPNGNLQYQPPADVFGLDTFEYVISDQGIFEENNGNRLDDALTDRATVSIFLTAVNDAPLLDQPNPVTMLEDTPVRTVVLTGIAAGGGESQLLRVSAISADTSLLPHPGVSYTSPNTTGTLTLSPVPDQFGVTSMTVTVEDAGLDGIFDDDPGTLGIDESADNLSITRTVSVRVNAVNDVPTLDPIAGVLIGEDSPSSSVGISGISAGGGEDQPLRVTATSDNPTLIANPTVAYTSPNSNGTLSFAPQPNQFGSATITVTVEDGGLDRNLSTLADNATTTQTFVITVGEMDDDPQLDMIPDQMIDEDSPAQTLTLTGINAGPNESQNLRVTATSDNPTLISNPTINYTSPASTAALIFAPNLDQVGSATITVTVEDGGADNDLSTPADNRSFSRMFTIDVNSVNDVPTITPIADFAIPEDALTQTLTLAGISAGGGESQPLRITATSNNTTLIPTPTVNYVSPSAGGTLTFTPAADLSGSATITLLIEDGGLDGDLSTPGDNATFSESFVVTVNAVNDLPTVDPVADQTALEDSGEQTIVLSGITAGGGESDPLRVTAVSGNPALLSNLVVTYVSPGSGGQLKYTPQANQFGSTTITVTVEDGGPDGLFSTPLDNASFDLVINVMILAVNDDPTLDDPADLVGIEEDSGQVTVPLTGITAGPNESQNLRVTAVADGSGRITDPVVNYTSPNSTGTLTFTPNPDRFGVTTITVTVEDGGADNDLSTTADNLTFSQTFTVTIDNLDDSPTPADDFITTDEDTVLQIRTAALLANDLDPDLGPGSNEALSIVIPVQSLTTLGATLTLGTNPTTGELTLTYDPRTSAQLQALAPSDPPLVDSFTYAVVDADGETNPPTATVFLTVSGINDAPTAVNDFVAAPETQAPIIIRPLANDFDVDGTLDLNTLIITQEPQFGSLARRINTSGELELAYSPFSNFSGNDSFRYTISDNLGQQSAQATVTIRPDPAPRTAPDVGGGVPADDIIINVLANDVPVQGQLDLSTLTIVSGPSNGQAIPQADGTVKYIPDVGFFGRDSFQYTIADTFGNVSAVSTVSVNVVRSGLENPLLFGDVNGSGSVTSLDALLIINRLARSGGQGPIPVLPDERGPLFYDVNGSLTITSLDALLVINKIGQPAAIVAGEAELASQASTAPMLIDIASTRGKTIEVPAVNIPFDVVEIESDRTRKLVDASLGDWNDEDLIEMLAAMREVDDVDSESSAALNDLAFLDL